MDFIGGQKPPPGAESKSLRRLVWDFFNNIDIRGKGEKKDVHGTFSNEQPSDKTSPCYLWCCFVGAVIWEVKAMVEQKLLRYSAIPTLPESQDSFTSQSFWTSSVIVGSKVRGTVDQ